MAIVLPGAQGLFSHMKEALRHVDCQQFFRVNPGTRLPVAPSRENIIPLYGQGVPDL